MIKLSVHNKIIITVIAVILFFGTIATLYVFFMTEYNLIDTRKEGILNENFQKSEIIGELFSQSEFKVKAISELQEVRNYLENEKDLQNEEILKSFERFNINDEYSAIYLMDTNGDVLTSTEKLFLGNNYAFRDYFQMALEGNPYVDVSIGVTSNEFGYYFSHPVFSEEGMVIGVIVVKQRPDHIHDLFIKSEKRNISPDYIRTLLVDKYGVVIYAGENEDEILYKSLGELKEEDLQQIKEMDRFGDIKIESLGYDIIQEKLEFIFAPHTFEIFDKYHDEDKIIVVNRVRKYPFFVISEVTSEGIQSTAFIIAQMIGSFVLMATLMAILLILLLTVRFLKPLNELQLMSEEILNGNYDYRLDIKSNDELKELGESFNKLAAKLNKFKSEFENKIEKRTSELEKMNKYMVDRELKMIELKKVIKQLKKNNEDKK